MNLLCFLSTAITPVPYLSFCTILGFFIFFKLNLRLNKLHFTLGIATLIMVALILFANRIHNINLNYEELKRILALVFSFLNFIFFEKIVLQRSESKKTRNLVLMWFALGELFASKIFWKLPNVAAYKDYSWFKYAGSYALILLIFQIYAASYISQLPLANLIIGFSIFIFAFLQDAKSTALIVLMMTLLRTRSLHLIDTQSPKKRNSIKFRTVFLPAFLILIAIQRLIEAGILGTSLKKISTIYGDSLLNSLLLARPELQFSLQLVKNMPFFGYGTLEHPLNNFSFNIASASNMSYGQQKYLLTRILYEGFNLHSWFFDLLVRGGFMIILPLTLYTIYLFKSIFDLKLLIDYPGIYFIVLTCIQDLFFSPFTWFVSIQIGISFLAINLTSLNRKSASVY